MLELNEISGESIGAAMCVHSTLGPGLLESTYSTCLAHELRLRGLKVELEVPVPIVYKGKRLRVGYRIDQLVEDKLLIELKVVKTIHPVYEAKLLSYLKLSDRKLGLLINFNVVHLKDGIKRIVNKL